MNQDNINTQGNNEITNNQPLNNQSFNQSMGVNQQPVNPQPQQPSSFQEPTPQPMNNTFESGNVNNQSLNSKSSKKMSLVLIIGIVVAVTVIVVVSIIFGTDAFKKNGNLSNGEVNYTDNIKNGKVELSMTSKKEIKRYDDNIIFYENYEYFQTKDSDNQFIVIDSKGKQVLPIEGKKLYASSYDNYKYLGDGYFIYNTTTDDGKITAILVKDGKLIISLDLYSDGVYYILASKSFYKNGVLYASTLKNTIAYDIKNKKELWKVDGVFIYGYMLDDDFIRLQTFNNPSGDNSGFLIDPIPDTIVDYNGKKIISGSDVEPIVDHGRKKYDTQIYTSKSKSYLEVKQKEFVKVYDLNNNLKTTISLAETDDLMYNFQKILYSGVFIISETNKTTYRSIEKLYNDKGEVLLTSDSIKLESYANAIGEEYILSKNLDLVSSITYENGNLIKYYYLIKDGKVLSKYERVFDPKNNYGLKHDYFGYSVKDKENSTLIGGYTYKTKIVNLNNMKEIDTLTKYTTNTKISNQSPYGEYVVLTTGNDYYVYNNELDLKYTSEDWVIPVNEKYFLTSNKYGRKENDEKITNLVNIETGKVNKLNVQGEYYSSNAKGLVTYDGTNYYLYTFN